MRSPRSFQVMSKQINTELDEQNMMLDDLGNDIESTQNKVDIALKKMAKVSSALMEEFLGT